MGQSVIAKERHGVVGKEGHTIIRKKGEGHIMKEAHVVKWKIGAGLRDQGTTVEKSSKIGAD